MVRTFHSVEAVSVIPFTCQRFTHASPHRSSCSHLAADLNFSRYWGRRLSWPGRSMRVQVLPCRRSGEKQRCKSHPHTSYFCPPTVLNSPCHFWLCMEHCCQWWRSVSAWTFQTAAANTWKAQKEISKQTNKQTNMSCPPPRASGVYLSLNSPGWRAGFFPSHTAPPGARRCAQSYWWGSTSERLQTQSKGHTFSDWFSTYQRHLPSVSQKCVVALSLNDFPWNRQPLLAS